MGVLLGLPPWFGLSHHAAPCRLASTCRATRLVDGGAEVGTQPLRVGHLREVPSPQARWQLRRSRHRRDPLAGDCCLLALAAVVGHALAFHDQVQRLRRCRVRRTAGPRSRARSGATHRPTGTAQTNRGGSSVPTPSHPDEGRVRVRIALRVPSGTQRSSTPSAVLRGGAQGWSRTVFPDVSSTTCSPNAATNRSGAPFA